MKTCTKCKETKPTTEFGLDRTRNDGYRPQCRVCTNLARKKSYYHGSDKGRYNTVRGKCVQLCASAKQRAKKRGLAFDLTSSFLEELWNKQGGKCALTGIPFKLDEDKANGYGPSLDKIDPKGGYTQDNVQWLLGLVNTMKSDHSMEEFKAHVALINHAFNTPSE